jgi:hypothetical protein
LDFEPEMLHNKEIASNQRNRGYLMNMNDDRKRMGMAYLAEWHMDVRTKTQDGAEVYNIHQVYDAGFLRELLKGGVINADRISSSLIAMFMLKENMVTRIQAVQQRSNFYDRTLFSNSTSIEETTSLY